jgi:hypothetical protein
MLPAATSVPSEENATDLPLWWIPLSTYNSTCPFSSGWRLVIGFSNSAAELTDDRRIRSGRSQADVIKFGPRS